MVYQLDLHLVRIKVFSDEQIVGDDGGVAGHSTTNRKKTIKRRFSCTRYWASVTLSDIIKSTCNHRKIKRYLFLVRGNSYMVDKFGLFYTYDAGGSV